MDDDAVNQPDNNPNDVVDKAVEREGESQVPQLDEDNNPPFGPPTDPVADGTADLDVREESANLDPTHPATNNATDIDSQQLYDEGLAGGAEVEEPNASDTVTGYGPENDQRNQAS
jgi:hypothetical protein